MYKDNSIMDETTVQIINGSSEEKVSEVLIEFNAKNSNIFIFPSLTGDLTQKCVTGIVHWLESKVSPHLHAACLETLRILSRDKNQLTSLCTEDLIMLLLRHSGIEDYAREHEEHIACGMVTSSSAVTIQDTEPEVIVEAQKCLCNLIFNSTQAQLLCSKHGCVEGIIQRLKTYKDPDLKHEIKFFDMRLLFLLTALCQDNRPKIRHNMHGITYLIEVIDLSLRDAEERMLPSSLNDQEAELCSEILKILFNLTVTVDKNILDEEEEAHFMRLVSVLHDLLLCTTTSKEKRDELKSHTVNLLTNMPRDCYEELLTPLNEGAVGGLDNKDVEFDGKNMEAIIALLDFLYNRSDKPTKALKENLTPILHCLCETCRANRGIRKFCRTKVLPPMRGEVMNLPEEGDSLRNRLCKLLTSPVTEVKDLVAEFLFIVCKENVARMVKYTGYGNCAGLLANRGLMLGGCNKQGDYSSDSEDSETEEYNQLKACINPVTGRWESEKSDPMAGMTEEQKEYEAVKLINLMDKLQREGIVQPSMVGEDGHPIPVRHVLELAEGISVPQIQEPNSDSD